MGNMFNLGRLNTLWNLLKNRSRNVSVCIYMYMCIYISPSNFNLIFDLSEI